jgi:hypothetical protein
MGRLDQDTLEPSARIMMFFHYILFSPHWFSFRDLEFYNTCSDTSLFLSKKYSSEMSDIARTCLLYWVWSSSISPSSSQDPISFLAKICYSTTHHL